MRKWTYAEYFLGMGSWSKAIKNVTEKHGDSCEFVYGFENDKFARNTFCAIHEEDKAKIYGDITNREMEVPKVDIVFYSPPCQSFSIAGRKGGTKDPRGNLFYDALHFIKKSKPKYAIMENVKNLAHQFKEDLDDMIQALNNASYISYSQILNSKDYGIPQNRERIFVVSIRKDVYDSGIRFKFPNKKELKLKLKDFLEQDVSKEYLLSEKMIRALTRIGTEFEGRFKPKNADNQVAHTISTRFDGRSTDNFLYVKSDNKKGYEVAKKGDSINIELPNNKARRGIVSKEVPQTIITQFGMAYYNGFNVRGLTVKEGFRLQGFTDEDYEKAINGYNSEFTPGRWKTQLKKRIGNSLTVNVIEEVLENLLYQRVQESV